MNCAKCQREIDDSMAAKGTVYPPEVSEHLKSCVLCAVYAREVSILQGALDGTSERVVPGELDDITFESILQAASGGKRMTIRRKQPWVIRRGWVPAAAAATIVAIFLAPALFKGAPTSIVTVGTAPAMSSVEIINDIAASDSLTGEFLVDLADDIDLENLADELSGDGNIDDLLRGLTQNEIEALYDRLENLKG
jgi:hypothetical protein